ATGAMPGGGRLGTVAAWVTPDSLCQLVGGIFGAEALSVIIQDKIGVKWLGRRFFARAPIHHHFQQRGLADTKIVIRFWIVAGILALFGLATIKIR
ncbi:MAG: phospho-N-acetylmuramoyl-pentapeptide-transferase, partial [Candidatus Latescibacterota bacterium]|nr:phospho-N-acetylmuramoyl-pentapeptide-transferase [Candidatus Latescibacterota bacterium]